MTTKVQAEFLAAGIISDQTQVSAASGDHVLIFDASDNSLKKTLISTIAGGLALDDIGAGDAASTLTTSSGNIILDSPADIVLDADGENILFKDGGTEIGQIDLGSNNVTLRSSVADKDTIFVGNDGGSDVEAMRIDYSEGGAVLIGTTDAQIYDHTSGEGIVFRNGEVIDIARSGDSQITLNRMSSEGANISLHQAGTLRGTIGTRGNGVYFGTSGDNERVRIDSSGNVGIGTTAPGGKLHIQKDGSETDVVVRSNIGGTGSANGGRLILQLGAMSNSGSGNADTQAGDTLGLIRFMGQGTDYSYDGAEINSVVETGNGSATRGGQGVRMSFKVMNVGVGYSQERFRIAQNGDLEASDTNGISGFSDERIKKNIADFTGGLNIVKSLQPRTFEYKDTSGLRKPGVHRGFVAQEILEKDSHWVYEREATDTEHEEYEFTKDTEKVYLSYLNSKDALYVSAIKELEARVKALEEK